MLRPALSSALALSLAVLPTNAALAMQPAESAPAPGAADAAPADGAAAAQPADGAAPAEGEAAPADGQAAPAEGEAAAGEAGEGEAAAGEAGEGEAAAGEAGEGEAAEGEAEAGEGEGEGDAAPLPEGPTDIDTPSEPKIGKWPAKGTGMLISGGVLLALGAGGLAASLVLTNCPEPANSIGCKNQDNRDFLVPIAASVMTVGVVLLVVGGANAAKYKRWKRSAGAKQALVPTFHRGGAGLGYVARF